MIREGILWILLTSLLCDPGPTTPLQLLQGFDSGDLRSFDFLLRCVDHRSRLCAMRGLVFH